MKEVFPVAPDFPDFPVAPDTPGLPPTSLTVRG